MANPTSAKLFPADDSSIVAQETDDGVVVVMTTEPRHVFRPEGFLRTATVTQWRRGPMHRDDAAVLIRIARAHGTDPAKWTPILPKDEEPKPERHDPTGGFGPWDGQGDFGDLFRS